MSSECCQINKREYLLGKARNFRDYINQYKPADEIQAYIKNFTESNLLITLMSVVVPIVQTKTTASAVRDLMKKMTVPDSEKAAVADKLARYLEMFAAVVLASPS